jgi:hypothetical protein
MDDENNLFVKSKHNELPHITSCHWFKDKLLLILTMINQELKFIKVKDLFPHKLDIEILEKNYICPF